MGGVYAVLPEIASDNPVAACPATWDPNKAMVGPINTAG
jgi:hypothetical protein